MDELIKEYAQKLQAIYDNRTAGDNTFEGVLFNFAQAAEPILLTVNADVDRITHPLLGSLSPGRPCEACGRDCKDHEWMELGENGFAVRCNFK